MKKFFILLSIFCLLFSPTNLFAEENEDNATDTDIVATDEQNDVINDDNDDDQVNYDDELNYINNNLNNINDILSRLTTTTANADVILSIATNYDGMSKTQLEFLYSNFDDYGLIMYFSNTGYLWYNFVITNVYTQDGNIFIQTSSHNRISQDGTITSHSALLIEIDETSVNTNLIKFDYDTYEYALEPYKLTIINNGAGSLSYNVNSAYSSSGIYYDGQSITLTYNNSNNDFNGWYINGVNVSNSTVYTFTIEGNTTLTINYESDSYAESNNNLYFIIVGLLTLICFEKFGGSY